MPVTLLTSLQRLAQQSSSPPVSALLKRCPHVIKSKSSWGLISAKGNLNTPPAPPRVLAGNIPLLQGDVPVAPSELKLTSLNLALELL